VPRGERVSFTSDGLTLEGMLHSGESSLVAVVMHPHPQYGGDMHSPVVTMLCATFAEAGATTLRFNFRGTGGSEGSYDGGRGEAGDAVAAADYVRSLQPDAEMLLAGYSFGALVASAATSAIRPAKLILVSPPSLDPDRLPDGIPALVVTGERDEIAPGDVLRAIESPSRRVVVVPGADHFWVPGGDALRSEVAAYIGAAAG
jgi:uncharacterized protein